MHDPDHLSKSRTQFDVSWKELMLRNFVAGFSRSIGLIVGQIIFFAIIIALLSRYVLPTLTPLLDTFQNASDIFTRSAPTDLQYILNQ